MKCPVCGESDTVVKDSRNVDPQNAIRRRRACEACGFRFTTFEVPQQKDIWVVKRDGHEEPFDRMKLATSVKIAILKRRVLAEEIDQMIGRIIGELESLPEVKVSSKQVGDMVLKELRQLDPVAYVRFASIYEKFQDVKDFVDLINKLEEESQAEPSSEVTEFCDGRTTADKE